MRKKVTVVGGGNVGATAAQRIAERDYADVVLVDVVEGMPQGKALDLAQSGPVLGYDSAVTGANSYETTANSDVVVITAGIARRPGMTRDDLLRTNMGIMSSVVSEVVAHSPDSILLIVSNPLDAMVYHAHKLSGFPKERVVGMAGILDDLRAPGRTRGGNGNDPARRVCLRCQQPFESDWRGHRICGDCAPSLIRDSLDGENAVCMADEHLLHGR